MFRSAQYVSDYVKKEKGVPVNDEQIETHGVELTIDKIFKLRGRALIQEGEYKKAKRAEAQKYNDMPVSPMDDEIDKDKNYYALSAGPYVVRYNERIEIPDDHVGFVFPRSRFIRNNAHVSTAVWDSGYKGRGEGGLHINIPTVIQEDMGIAQFTLAKSKVFTKYKGLHNKENIDGE